MSSFWFSSSPYSFSFPSTKSAFSLSNLWPSSFSVISVSKTTSTLGPEFRNPWAFPYYDACGSVRFTWMYCISPTCVQTIARWPSATVTRVCAIKMIGRQSSIGCPAVNVAFMCHAASVPKYIAPLVAFIKRLNITRMFRRSCDVLMDSHYPNVVRCLSSCIVRLVSRTLPSASITGRMIATLTLLCSVMLWE